MRNISSVFQERGIATVRIFLPADRVGTGVTARISRLADQNPLLPLVRRSRSARYKPVSIAKTDDAENQLGALLAALRGAGERPGIGHNSSSQADEELSENLAELNKTAKDLLAAPQQDVNPAVSLKPVTAREVEKHRNSLVRLGIRFAGWLAKRATKSIDAGLAGLALYLGHLTGGPHIASSVSSVSRWLMGL